jgi:hypothetical protein
MIVITSILMENTLYTVRSHQGTCDRIRSKLYDVLGRRDHSDSMGDLPLAASNSDHDLLFGIVSIRMNFIVREAFITARAASVLAVKLANDEIRESPRVRSATPTRSTLHVQQSRN